MNEQPVSAAGSSDDQHDLGLHSCQHQPLAVDNGSADDSTLIELENKRWSNFYHIAYLIIEEGTPCVRKKFRDHLGSESFVNWLRPQKNRLKTKIGHGLFLYQFKKLFPSKGCSPDLDSLDISILVALLKTTDEIPADCGWLNDFDELQNMRNILYAHATRLSMTDEEYNSALTDLTIFLQKQGITLEKINAKYKVVPVEKMRQIEFQMSRLDAAAINDNSLAVQDTVERLLRAMWNQEQEQHFNDLIVGAVRHLQEMFNQKCAALEESLAANDRSPGVVNTYQFAKVKNMQIGNNNSMIIRETVRHPKKSEKKTTSSRR